MHFINVLAFSYAKDLSVGRFLTLLRVKNEHPCPNSLRNEPFFLSFNLGFFLLLLLLFCLWTVKENT